MQRGKLIAIEGADGAGTTTVSEMLREELRKWPVFEDNHPYFTCEPSVGLIGQLIRRVLTGREGMFSDKCMELLFRADRLEHDLDIIRKCLSKDRWVITDRHYPSTLVYQSVNNLQWDLESDDASEFERRVVGKMDKMFWSYWYEDGIKIPDLTIYLKASPETLAERREKRGGEAEIYENEKFQRKVVRLYDVWSEHEKFNVEGKYEIRTVDASQSANKVAAECCNYIKDFLDGEL